MERYIAVHRTEIIILLILAISGILEAGFDDIYLLTNNMKGCVEKSGKST